MHGNEYLVSIVLFCFLHFVNGFVILQRFPTTHIMKTHSLLFYCLCFQQTMSEAEAANKNYQNKKVSIILSKNSKDCGAC